MKFLKELSDLNEGTLVLTSTERVARHLRLQSALLQSMSGKKAWFNKGRIQTCGFHGHPATHSMSIWPPIPR
ncbi:hypothetical protein H2O04_24775 [Pseudomonas aeruginosa]|uniref:hypothetical protein n=1 Tax=Pseudomonas aeruginosa TaxID=287 RepID=UPI0015F012B1|nr:hypothetical protein [Pseudomonas aeruginosa]MBA5026221.1 hypothetical protein [Pseudomonas aeruginosa]MBA5132625.1 hypothetical protein [Pseudomonas aeruginosa]